MIEEKPFRLEKNSVPKWLQKIGCFDISRDSIRFNYGSYGKKYEPYIFEISRKIGLAFQFYNNHHLGLNFHFIYPGFYIPLFPRWIKLNKSSNSFFPSWGFSFFNNGNEIALHLNWGDKTKIIYPPFRWVFGYRETMMKDATWYRESQSNKLSKIDDWTKEYEFLKKNKMTVKFPYSYLLRSGDVQKVMALISVERSYRFRNRLQWLGWPKKEQYYIEVEFRDLDDHEKIAEVGERSGSWKGGCTACSYEMKKDENVYQTLKRMEQERKF